MTSSPAAGAAGASSPASSAAGAAGPADRRRKSAEESRTLIIDAARTLFGTQGFANTTVKEVARLAGVVEIVVYRQFPSKVDLFEHVMVGDLVAFIEDWFRRLGGFRPGEGNPEEVAHGYVAGVYEVVSAHRGQLLALISASAFEPQVAGAAPLSRINEALRGVAAIVRREATHHGWPIADAELTARATFGMIFSLAMFPDWLVPADQGYSDSDVVRELTTYLVEGVVRRSKA